MIEVHDALPESIQDYLEDMVHEVPWRYIDDVSFPQVLPGDHYKQPGFNFTPMDDGRVNKEDWDKYAFLMPLFREQYIKAYKSKAVPVQPWRLRWGLNIPGEALHNNAHVDYTDDISDRIKTNVVCLYYVNSDDGDTFIFNETGASTAYNIQHRVKAEKGKMVFFNGDYYHASSPAKSSGARVVISLNLYEFRW